jgi:hypothetical protein
MRLGRKQSEDVDVCSGRDEALFVAREFRRGVDIEGDSAGETGECEELRCVSRKGVWHIVGSAKFWRLAGLDVKSTYLFQALPFAHLEACEDLN